MTLRRAWGVSGGLLDVLTSKPINPSKCIFEFMQDTNSRFSLLSTVDAIRLNKVENQQVQSIMLDEITIHHNNTNPGLHDLHDQVVPYVKK